MRERESGRYGGVANAAWNNNRANDPTLLSPTYTVPSDRGHDPYNTYAAGDTSIVPTPYNNPYTNLHMDHAQPQMPQPVATQDMAGPYPNMAPFPAGGSSSAITRPSSMSRRRSGGAGYGMGRKIKQFVYRPNSTLTDHERMEAAGSLTRIESQEGRAANRLRGGAPISASSYSSHSNAGYDGDGYALERSPPVQEPLQTPPRPLRSPPRHQREQQQQNSSPRPSPRSSPSKNTSRTLGAGHDGPQSPQGTRSPYGYRPRGDSDVEMSHLVDLLVSRSSPPDRMQTNHLASATSLGSNYTSSNNGQLTHTYKSSAAMGSSGLLPRVGEHRDEDDGVASTFGTESILSSRGPSRLTGQSPPLPMVAITPASPLDINKRLRERWYGKPI